jgi:acetoin utilization protein AcuB
MDVGGCMTRNPLTVSPNDSIRKAQLLMRQGQVRRLPVVENRQIVGIVTDRDIWERSPARVTEGKESEGGDLSDHLRIMGIMTLQPVRVSPTLPIVEAAQQLRRSHIGALLVVDDSLLVGILTKGNLIDALVDAYGAAVTASQSAAPPSSDTGKTG